jgi:peptidoglycan/xylan/chitin deacetylase (PgdA/CDA1 family)
MDYGPCGPRMLSRTTTRRGIACLLAGSLLLGASGGAHARRGSLEPVPILMYHVIGSRPAGAPFPELYVGTADFTGQVAWLASHGYTAVTLGAVYRSWRYGSPLPKHPIVLSFDDGYSGDYWHALPILRARHWAGVLNLEVRKETYPGGLAPRRIRALIGAGWEIDAHTMTHPDLTTVDAARLRYEVAGSRASIRRRFHVPVDFFCYPAGRYDAAVIAAVQAAGYLGATTTQFGLARPADLFTLDRVRVNGSDGVAGLAAKLKALALPS